jgi:tRNA nucleotidyltransferase (CCA-adding enzyme)
VRDLVLGRPIRDVDLLVIDPSAGEVGDDATVSPAARLAEAARRGEGRVLEHGRFGTVRFEEESAHVDLASVRRETYRRPGALPDVEPGSFEDDMARRDFSVNAMSVPLPSVRPDATTSLLDPLGGLGDLEKRTLRVLHPHSFHDDPTRALRAARLAARLDFSLARSTRSALRDALRDGIFGGVSGERLRREIQRCFSDAALGLNPAQALRLLESWHVLQALEPGLALARESLAPLRRLGRQIAEPLWRQTACAPWQPGLALWLAPLPAALRRRTLARFSIRGEAADRIIAFPETRDRVLGDLARVRGRGAVDELLARLPEDTLQALYASCEAPERKRLVRWAAEDRPRRSPVSGADLLDLGLSGPDVGRILTRLRAAYLDGDVANREEALALATELARREKSPGRAGRASGKRTPAKRAAKAGRSDRKQPARKAPKKKAGRKKATRKKASAKAGARARRPEDPGRETS